MANIALVFAIVTVECKLCCLVVNGWFPFKKLIGDQPIRISFLNFLVQRVSVLRRIWTASPFEMVCDTACGVITGTTEWALDSILLGMKNGTSVVLILDNLIRPAMSARVQVLARLAT